MEHHLHHAPPAIPVPIPDTMHAMVLEAAGLPLHDTHIPVPSPGPHDVLIRVHACGVCRTDLHIADGELPRHKTPLVMGHEVVGWVLEAGALVERFAVGERIGIPWLGSTCSACDYCMRYQENLCDNAAFTGYDRDGGYAQYMVADARYGFHLPDRYDDLHAAPLLCAGLIGYRAYAMAGDAERIGIYGFGAAAHIIAQLARHQGREVYAFTRPGDHRAQAFARALGAVWAGDSDRSAPVALDAALLFAPVGALVPQALAAVRKGGIVVCGGIHMSDVPAFPYALLWGERVVRSVANLTRHDGERFFDLARQFALQVKPVPFALGDANEALNGLRSGLIEGAAVLVP